MWFDGVPHPDWPAPYVMRVCAACEATWVGFDGEECAWCASRARWDMDAQRALLLTRPEGSHAAWARRLDTAVEAGIVTEGEAIKALRGAGRGRRRVERR